MANFNPIGQKYGKWKVIKRAGKQGKQPTWLCVCECGNEGIVPSYNLKAGRSTNCGCVRKETLRKMNTTHDHSGSRIHNIWMGMKFRCYNTSGMNYKDYGGRGIEMCEEWKEEFTSFYEWSIENGYNDDLTIDRKNNDLGYTPSNCHWTDRKKQANNQRKNHYIKYMGEVKTLAEWCEQLNLNYSTIKRRIYRGWDVEKAFSTPIKGGKRNVND
jgi:hypothetical protein